MYPGTCTPWTPCTPCTSPRVHRADHGSAASVHGVHGGVQRVETGHWAGLALRHFWPGGLAQVITILDIDPRPVSGGRY